MKSIQIAMRASRSTRWVPLLRRAAPLAIVLVIESAAAGDPQADAGKRVIGATAIITEEVTGLAFAARVDTGAASCSLHVDRVEIDDESARPAENLGKRIRFQITNEKGESKWIDSTIAGIVRIRSSVQAAGEFDRRYKVRLTLHWKDFSKEVLVTLSDRGEMNYPLLIGRNYLRGDFVVDVDMDNPE